MDGINNCIGEDCSEFRGRINEIRCDGADYEGYVNTRRKRFDECGSLYQR
ncbi:MAG: hypothetical protein N2746_11020 [Deltaproteobacteria bacterium]|nr:hypothetical protein [Deltaproteobacteria bacterium]